MSREVAWHLDRTGQARMRGALSAWRRPFRRPAGGALQEPMSDAGATSKITFPVPGNLRDIARDAALGAEGRQRDVPSGARHQHLADVDKLAWQPGAWHREGHRR